MATTIYVSSDYNSSTQGWGATAFNSINSAENYADSNAKDATIIVQKTTTVSGNSFQIKGDKNGNQNSMTFIICDGAIAGNANSKWDMTATVTVQAGGRLVTSRPSTASAGYMHTKDTLTLAGDKENGKYAFLEFGKGSYNSIDVSTLGNGKIVANYAKATFGDLALQAGAGTFTDSIVTVEGALSTGLGFLGKLTLTGTTVEVLGHHSRSDSYFKGYNQLKYVTMTNSSITIDDGDEGTVADKVTFNSVTMTNSTITVESGAAARVEGTVTLNASSALTVGTLTINSGQKINMEYTCTVNFDDIVLEGTSNVIVSNLSSYASGTYKLFDYTGTGSYTEDQYKALFGTGNWSNKFAVINNDLYLTDADRGTVTVNGDWDADNAEGFFGYNSYNHIADAVRAAASDSRISEIIVTGYANGAAELYPFAVNGEIVSDNATGLLVNMGEGDESAIYGGVVIGANVTVIAGGLAVDPFKVADIQGSLTVGEAYIYGGTVDVTGTLTVTGDFTLQDGYGSVTTLTVQEGGTLTAANVYGTPDVDFNINGTADIANFQAGESVVDLGGTLKGANKVATLNIVAAGAVLDSVTESEELVVKAAATSATATKSITTGTAAIEAGAAFTLSGANFTADTVTVAGTFAVTGESTINIGTLTGVVEAIGGSLTDSGVGGKLLVSGDTEFKGTNNFGAGVIKVTNGATLTIGAQATLAGAETYIGAGNEDISYYGIENSETAKGIINIAGNVNVCQINANAGGEITVAAGANVTAGIICVENGSIAEAAAGTFTVESGATVNTQRFNVFGGASAEIKGALNSEQAYTSDTTLQNVISVWDNSTLTINGGVVTAAQIEHTEGRHSKMNIAEGSTLALINQGKLNFGGELTNNGTIAVNGSTFTATSVKNDNLFTVSGESTINIGTLTGKSVDFLDGAVIKDSTIGGSVFVAGNVTFKGDNTFNMIYDYGTLTDYYGTTAPMKWTVVAGASVTVVNKDRYGLGYGDQVTVLGEIAKNGAAAARAALNNDPEAVKKSLFMHGLVAQESTGWNCSSSLTVTDAYVQIGSNNSFGNKPGSYGGTYTFNFTNSVLDSSRITFYEALSQTTFTFTGCDVKTGTFMTRDKDSVFTLDNTVLLSTTTTNGTDEGNYHAGTLNLNGSRLTYSAELKNEAGVINISSNSQLYAPVITNNGVINMDVTSTIVADQIKGDGSINITINTELLTGGNSYMLINTVETLDLSKINVAIDGAEAAALQSLFYTPADTFVALKEGTDASYTLVFEKSENDLVVHSVSNTIYVSSDYSGTYGESLGNGLYYGINAFSSLKDVSQAVSEAPCTVVYDFTAEMGTQGGVIITVNNDADSLVAYTMNGEYHHFYSERTHEIVFEDVVAATGSNKVTFTFTSGDFSFESSTVAKNEAGEVGVNSVTGKKEVEEFVAVNELAGDKVYTFTVATDGDQHADFGTLECSLSGIQGTGEIAIYDEGGNLVYNRLFNRDTDITVSDLAAGSYSVVFSGYGYNPEAEFTANMKVSEYEAADYRYDDVLTGATTLETGYRAAEALGAMEDNGVDTVDWFHITGLTGGVENAIDFTVEGAPVFVTLYDGSQNLLANFYVYDEKDGSAVDYTRFVSASTSDIYVRLSSTGNADYTIAAVGPVA